MHHLVRLNVHGESEGTTVGAFFALVTGRYFLSAYALDQFPGHWCESHSLRYFHLCHCGFPLPFLSRASTRFRRKIYKYYTVLYRICILPLYYYFSVYRASHRDGYSDALIGLFCAVQGRKLVSRPDLNSKREVSSRYLPLLHLSLEPGSRSAALF